MKNNLFAKLISDNNFPLLWWHSSWILHWSVAMSRQWVIMSMWGHKRLTSLSECIFLQIVDTLGRLNTQMNNAIANRPKIHTLMKRCEWKSEIQPVYLNELMDEGASCYHQMFSPWKGLTAKIRYIKFPSQKFWGFKPMVSNHCIISPVMFNIFCTRFK